MIPSYKDMLPIKFAKLIPTFLRKIIFKEVKSQTYLLLEAV